MKGAGCEMSGEGGLTVLMVPGLSVCGGQGEVVQSGEVSVLVSERADGGMAAQGGGTLEVVGGCLGAGGSVIVWPHGTQVVQDQPLAIRIPGLGTYTLGDEVLVAGGYVLEHSSRNVEAGDFLAGGVSVPAECAEHDVFLAN